MITVFVFLSDLYEILDMCWSVSKECLSCLRRSNLFVVYVRVVKSRRMRWVGHVACMGEGRGVHRVLVGKPEGKSPLGRPIRRWEDNIKMDLQRVVGWSLDGVGSGWVQVAETCE